MEICYTLATEDRSDGQGQGRKYQLDIYITGNMTSNYKQYTSIIYFNLFMIDKYQKAPKTISQTDKTFF